MKYRLSHKPEWPESVPRACNRMLDEAFRDGYTAAPGFEQEHDWLIRVAAALIDDDTVRVQLDHRDIEERIRLWDRNPDVQRRPPSPWPTEGQFAYIEFTDPIRHRDLDFSTERKMHGILISPEAGAEREVGILIEVGNKMAATCFRYDCWSQNVSELQGPPTGPHTIAFLEDVMATVLNGVTGEGVKLVSRYDEHYEGYRWLVRADARNGEEMDLRV